MTLVHSEAGHWALGDAIALRAKREHFQEEPVDRIRVAVIGLGGSVRSIAMLSPASLISSLPRYAHVLLSG